MDDLFVIDTQGSKSTNVATTSVDREFRAVGSNSKPTQQQRQQKQKRGQQRGVIDDSITASTGSSTAGTKSNSGSMKGLNLQFLGLGVNEGKGKQKYNPRNKYGNVKGRAARKAYEQSSNSKKPQQQKFSRKRHPGKQQHQQHQEDTDGDIIADFIENLGEQGILDIVNRTPSYNSAYISRDLGGDAGVNPGPAPGEAAGGSDSNAADDDSVVPEIDDPYEHEDEMVGEILYGSSSAEDSDFDQEFDGDDDGIPIDLDMEALPGPATRVPNQGRSHRHLQKSQNARAFKEKDRLKSKNSHAKQKGGKGQGNEDGPSPGFDPRTVIKRLELLASGTDLGSIWLQPMNTYERRIVHILAREYNVKSKSHGGGSSRSTVLTPTPSTSAPRNSRRIKKLLLLFDAGGLIPPSWCGGQTPKSEQGYSKGKKSSKGSKGMPPKTKLHGKMVAENAPVVGDSNVGHQMLKQMGWAPGQGLGANQEGRATPVDVMIRTGRQGLGA